MSLFTISFTKKLDADNQNIENKTILEKYKKEFWQTDCDKIEIIDDKSLKIKNNLIRLKFKANIDLWYGIMRAELSIHKDRMYDRDIVYSINILPIIVILLSSILFIALSQPSLNTDFIIFGISFFMGAGLLMIGIQILRHYLKFSRIFKAIIKENE